MKKIKKLSYKSRREDTIVSICPDCVVPDVTIGVQIWTGCNLNVSKYRNGDDIPEVTDKAVWDSLTTGAWCWYNNDPLNGAIYGKLYNWYAVNDPRGLAPSGYHIPTDAEFTTLTNYLGGNTVAGGALKKIGTGLCTWTAPNTGATNSSGFTLLPAGYRNAIPGVSFLNINNTASLWTSTEDESLAWLRGMQYNTASVLSYAGNKNTGMSVRLIKDPVVACPDIVIGTQTWTSCNLDVSTYRNGDSIPQVTDPTAWAGLTTGAWCWYNNDPLNGTVYKKLYNWHAIADPRGLAPIGYHIPTKSEWDTLITTLGGETIAGGKMKETGIVHWEYPNTGATNSSGFTALGGGFRNTYNGIDYSLKNSSFFWSSTIKDASQSWVYYISASEIYIVNAASNLQAGYSVRLIKD